jgi:hypothetical protein
VTPRATTLTNYLAYQTGWFAAVVGAALGHGAAGAVLAAGLMAAHLWLARERGRELRGIVLATVVGALIETWQLRSGTYAQLSGGAAPLLPPWWLLALWAQFATTFRYSLQGVLARPAAAMLFGAVGGPLAFLAGERLGAVVLATPLWPGLTRLALGWTAALALFAWTARRPVGPPPRYRAIW